MILLRIVTMVGFDKRLTCLLLLLMFSLYWFSYLSASGHNHVIFNNGILD